MEDVKEVSTDTLRAWLETGKKVTVLDIRPIHERTEWFIPGSIYFNAYDKLKTHKPDALHGLHLDKTIPVIIICAGGKTSLIAAEQLREKGFEAYSLQGGMKGWGLSWNTAKLSFPDFEIIQFRRTGKGCLSYIVASNGEAIIVDASLPIETYQQVLVKEKMILKYVLETHIHADHLSRSKQLASELAVDLMLPTPNKVSFEYKELHENQIIQLGKISIKVIPTPGHTLESVCFLVNKEVLFSGDTIFTNAVGRPDLKANEEETAKRAGLLYDSLQRLMELDDNITVLPAHTNTPVDFDGKPIKANISEIKKNVSVLHLSKVDFVKTILDKLPPTPPNHLVIIERNLSGNISDVNPIDLEAGANRCAVS